MGHCLAIECLPEKLQFKMLVRTLREILAGKQFLSAHEVGTSGQLKGTEPLNSVSTGLQNCLIYPFQRFGIYFDEVLKGD